MGFLSSILVTVASANLAKSQLYSPQLTSSSRSTILSFLGSMKCDDSFKICIFPLLLEYVRVLFSKVKLASSCYFEENIVLFGFSSPVVKGYDLIIVCISFYIWDHFEYYLGFDTRLLLVIIVRFGSSNKVIAPFLEVWTLEYVFYCFYHYFLLIFNSIYSST